jgi:mannose-6-phosphate isomerase-like protein (cupin superfamily)
VIVKIEGDFVWHHHDVEDELFLVTKGEFTMKIRDPIERDVLVQKGEFIVIPAGVEHCPCASEECEIILLEPATTINTGNVENERTVNDLGAVVAGELKAPTE